MGNKYSSYISSFPGKKFSLKHDKKLSEHARKFIGWKNTLILMFVFFTWFLLMAVINSNVNSKGNAFYLVYFWGGHTSAKTYFPSLFLIGNCFALFPTTILLDKIGIRRTVFIGISALIVGICLLIAAHLNYRLAIAAALLTGAGGAISILPNLKLTFQFHDSHKSSLPISLSIGFALIGGVLGPVLAPQLYKFKISQSGAGGLFVILFIVIILFFSNFFITEKDFLIGKHYKTLPSYTSNIFHAALRKRNWIFFLIIALINLPVSLLVWNIGTPFVSHYYPAGTVSSKGANTLMSAIILGSILGSVVWGFLANHLRKRRKLILCGTFFTAVCVFFAMNKTDNFGFLYFIYFFIGFACASQNLIYPLISEQNSNHLAGAANTLNSLVILGLPVIIQNLFRQEKSSNYTHALLIIGFIVIATIVLAFFIKDTKYKLKEA